jgi:fucose permease
VSAVNQTGGFRRDRFTWLSYGMLAYYAYLQAALGPVMPFLRGELDLSYTQGGLHLSAFALGMILAGVIGERVTVRWGRSRVFWGSGVGMALATLGFVAGGHIALTLLSVLLMGWLGCLLLVTIQSSLADHHGALRAVALTEANTAASLSAGLAPLVLGAGLGLGAGWRLTMLVGVAALGVLALSARGEAVPEGQRGVGEKRASADQLPAVFWAYWVVIFLGVATEWCLVFWGADFMEKVVGLERGLAATMMSLFFLAMVLGRFAGSRLTRVMAGERLLPLALAITLVGFPLFWLGRWVPLNLAGLFLAGLGVANLFPLTLAVAVGTVPEQADRASARLVLGTGVAILSAPLLVGWLADQMSIQQAYGIVAVLIVLAIAATGVAAWLGKRASKALARTGPFVLSVPHE